jgi:hypothetical protein
MTSTLVTTRHVNYAVRSIRSTTLYLFSFSDMLSCPPPFCEGMIKKARGDFAAAEIVISAHT